MLIHSWEGDIRLLRHILTFFRLTCAVLAGLLLFIAIRTYFVEDDVSRNDRDIVTLYIALHRGSLRIDRGWNDNAFFDSSGPDLRWSYATRDPGPAYAPPPPFLHPAQNFNFPGFHFFSRPPIDDGSPIGMTIPGYWSLNLSLYYPLALLATYPLIDLLFVLRSRLRRRRNPALCRTCNYDLRASPARCPECGTVRAS